MSPSEGAPYADAPVDPRKHTERMPSPMLSSLWTHMRHIMIGYALLVAIELAPDDLDGHDLLVTLHQWAERCLRREQDRRILAAHQRRARAARNPPP